MKRCDTCGATILFGPVRQGNRIYCKAACRDQDVASLAASHLPADLVVQSVRAIHEGSCPVCGGEGPIDVHVSHHVLSMFVLTSFKSEPKICCHRCGRNAKIKAILLSGLFGWWGVPWGMLGTPVQILRNLPRNKSSDQEGPSRALLRHGPVRTCFAIHKRHKFRRQPNSVNLYSKIARRLQRIWGSAFHMIFPVR